MDRQGQIATRRRLTPFNETARAQGHHGIKGAAHGIKGGRPRLDLTDEERAERRRKQQEAWRRRQGIQPKKTGSPKSRTTNWAQTHVEIWGKSPGVPLTPEEYAEREPLWNARVLAKIEEAKSYEAKKLARRELRRTGRQRSSPPPAALPALPPADPSPRIRPSPVASAVGRTSPCPCGSGRKFKKCCGR
ncbi:SEC-C metal-binding domain-containing protein [Luteolibacter marinus]|uniref:SEC-C metal-binding domain-containing protein n=1 Tax=Luteolibacter marinus TaxID=2776705 RepID=UPI001866A7C8|nr:SEC-C metal-binding domain-containing protein [Luteolibacter marinus]